MICFTKTDDSLNKADVRFLEAELVELAKVAGTYAVDNNTMPSPPEPPEAERADIDSFLTDILAIVPLLGVSAFVRRKPASVAGDEKQVFEFKMAGTAGRGLLTPQGFLLLAGSTGRVEETSTLSNGYRNLRAHLVDEGSLVNDGHGNLRAEADILFPNPTQAAVALYGGQVSGPQHWHLAHDGTTLRDYLERPELAV